VGGGKGDRLMVNIKLIFSKRLSELRQLKGFSMYYIADKLNIKEPSVTYYFNGKGFPSAVNLIALADLFGVSIDYLVGRTDEPEINKKV
jgi:transcriptional regulator with XRE-family HTH domain